MNIETLSLKQVERSVYLAVTSVPTDSSGIETSFSRLMSEEAERLRKEEEAKKKATEEWEKFTAEVVAPLWRTVVVRM